MPTGNEAKDLRVLHGPENAVAYSRPHIVSRTSTPVTERPGAPVDVARIDTGALASRREDADGWTSIQPRRPAVRSVRYLAYAAGKRAFDIVGAVALLLVFSPLMLVISLLLWMEGGSVIYRHRRVGRNGRMFDCLKFRTMVPNADQVLRELLEKRPELRAEWIRDHKLRDDPRVTAVGRFLRRTSLDELPQLWNVLRGEMSLVGPRPVVREELMRYGRNAAFYLSVKPGLTGLWQVTGRNDVSYRRRVVLDVYYIRKQNLLLDCYILFKTPSVVFGGGGAY
jgi:Sugar transferases involved in lipopolysaccharide synthesis